MLRVVLRGLSASAEGALQDALASVPGGGAGACVVDGSELRGMDGAGLLALAMFCAQAAGRGRRLWAVGLDPAWRRLWELLGFTACLGFASTEAQALAGESSPPLPPPEAGRIPPEGWLDPWAPGPQLVGPLEGFGELWHKVYRLPLQGGGATVDEAARMLKARLPEFWPDGNRLTLPPEGVAPGAVAEIALRLTGGVPLHTGAQVVHAADRSFTLATLSGHVEAGWIHFSAFAEEGGTTVQVQSLGRGSDPLYEAGLRLFGHAEQEAFWRSTLERVARELGVPARVETRRRLVDAALRWSAAANLRHSATLKTPLILLGEAVEASRSAAPAQPPPPAAEPRPERRRILVLGGGYGGLACLRGLSGRLPPHRYEVRLVDATPYHEIKTRFHERAVLPGREAALRLPLTTLATASGAEFCRDEALEVDFVDRAVRGRGDVYRYDRLVLALGGQIAHFGVEGADEHTVSLQTYEQAVACCRRVQALRRAGAEGRARRVVVVGAGIEGLEVATMVRQELPARDCEVLVVERSPELMAQSQCREPQRAYVRGYLERRGIALRLGTAIRAVEAGHVVLESGERLASDLTIWCSGIRPVAVAGIPDPFRVGPCLQSPDHPEVFAVGDFATVDSAEEAANLRSAQRAAYHGALVAENLIRLEAGRPLEPARYRPVGELIALGDLDGVGVVLGAPLTGLRAALLKKAHEVKYLADTSRDLPGAAARGLLSLGRRALSV